MDYATLGQTTHLAASIEQLAPPDTILISRDTQRLVDGYVQVKFFGLSAKRMPQVVGVSDSAV